MPGFSFPVVPHITDAIQEWVMRQAQIPVDEDGIEPQVCVIEVCTFKKKKKEVVLFLVCSKLIFIHIYRNVQLLLLLNGLKIALVNFTLMS